MESKQFAAFEEELFHLLTENFGDKWNHVWDAEEDGFYLRLTVHGQPKMWAEDDEPSKEDDLAVSEYERGYLMSFYDNHAKPKMIEEGFTDPTDEETFWIGVQIGERMFDLAIYYENTKLVCMVYECKPTEDMQNWVTDMSLGREQLI